MCSVGGSPASSSNRSATSRFTASETEKIKEWIEAVYKKYKELKSPISNITYDFQKDELKLWVTMAANRVFEEYVLLSGLPHCPGTSSTDFSNRFINTLIPMLLNPVREDFKEHFRFYCLVFSGWMDVSSIHVKNQLCIEVMRYKTTTDRKEKLTEEEKKKMKVVLFPRPLSSGGRGSKCYTGLMKTQLLLSGYNGPDATHLLQNTYNFLDKELKGHFVGIFEAEKIKRTEENGKAAIYILENSAFTISPIGMNEALLDPAIRYFKTLKKSSQSRYKSESPHLNEKSIAERVFKLAPPKDINNIHKSTRRYIIKNEIRVSLPMDLLQAILNDGMKATGFESSTSLYEMHSSSINPESVEGRSDSQTDSPMEEGSDDDIEDELDKIGRSGSESESEEQSEEEKMEIGSGRMTEDEGSGSDIWGSSWEECIMAHLDENTNGDRGLSDRNKDESLPLSLPFEKEELVESPSGSIDRNIELESISTIQQYLNMMVNVLYASPRIRPLTLISSEPLPLDAKWRTYASLAISLSDPEWALSRNARELLCCQFGFNWIEFFDKFVELNRMNSLEPQLIHHFGFCSEKEEDDSIFVSLTWRQEEEDGFICGIRDLIHSMEIDKVAKTLWINIDRSAEEKMLIIPGDNWSPFERCATYGDSLLKYRLQAVILKEMKGEIEVLSTLIRFEDVEGRSCWTEYGSFGSKPAQEIFQMYLRIFSSSISLIYVTEGLATARFMDPEETISPSHRVLKTQETISEKTRLNHIKELRLDEEVDAIDRFECRRKNRRLCLKSDEIDKESNEREKLQAEINAVIPVILNKRSRRNIVHDNMKLPDVDELMDFLLKEGEIKIILFKSKYVIKYETSRIVFKGNGMEQNLCPYCMSLTSPGKETDKINPCSNCYDKDFVTIMFVIRARNNKNFRLPYLQTFFRDEPIDELEMEGIMRVGFKKNSKKSVRKRVSFPPDTIEMVMYTPFERSLEATTAAFAFQIWDWLYFRFIMKRKEEYHVSSISQSELQMTDLDPVLMKQYFITAAERDGYRPGFNPITPLLTSKEREDMMTSLLCRTVRDKSTSLHVRRLSVPSIYSMWFKKEDKWILYYGKSSGLAAGADYHYRKDRLERVYRLGWLKDGIIEQFAIATTSSKSIVAALEGSAQLVLQLAFMFKHSHSYKKVVPLIGNVKVETFDGHNLRAEPIEYLNLILRTEFGQTVSFEKIE